MESNGRPLVPYLRQSRAKERTISIDEQRRDIARWADANGVTLAPEVVEQGVSGSKPWRERALGDAVDACERGEAAGIIVAWQDRLSRENGLGTAEVWEALERAGARLVCAAEGLDTAAGDHEMTFTIKAAIARDQWKRHRANWQRAQRSSIERGVPNGRANIGYRKQRGGPMKVVQRRAAKVVEAFELRAAGVPYSQIGRRFGWSHSTTRQILCNDVYLGVLGFGGYVNENAHEAIISRELFDAAQASRTTAPVPPGATTADRILIGLARCGGCGKTLKVVRRPRVDGTYAVAYYCKNAASVPCLTRAFVHADALDAFVAEWFERALATAPRLIDVAAASRELEEAQRERDAAQQQLYAFVEAADALDPVLLQRGIAAREKRLEAARTRVSELSVRTRRLPLGGALIGLWRDFGPAERRDVLAGFLDHVSVARGASGDLAANVHLFWADGTIIDVAHDERRVGVAAA